MIELHAEAFVIEMSDGNLVPCTSEAIIEGFLEQTAGEVDPQLVRQAALAILHFYRVECGRTRVKVEELVRSLTTVIEGFSGRPAEEASSRVPGRMSAADLRQLAGDSGEGFELWFFVRLRSELRELLAGRPAVVQFHGLRGCVRQLTRSERWTRRCQRLNDQIVDYLRQCLGNEPGVGDCALLVR